MICQIWFLTAPHVHGYAMYSFRPGACSRSALARRSCEGGASPKRPYPTSASLRLSTSPLMEMIVPDNSFRAAAAAGGRVLYEVTGFAVKSVQPASSHLPSHSLAAPAHSHGYFMTSESPRFAACFSASSEGLLRPTFFHQSGGLAATTFLTPSEGEHLDGQTTCA